MCSKKNKLGITSKTVTYSAHENTDQSATKCLFRFRHKGVKLTDPKSGFS